MEVNKKDKAAPVEAEMQRGVWLSLRGVPTEDTEGPWGLSENPV